MGRDITYTERDGQLYSDLELPKQIVTDPEI